MEIMELEILTNTQLVWRQYSSQEKQQPSKSRSNLSEQRLTCQWEVKFSVHCIWGQTSDYFAQEGSCGHPCSWILPPDLWSLWQKVRYQSRPGKFWIVNASSVVRKILSKCFSCQRRQGPFREHKMADLPVDRVTPRQPPFISVSIDCFGPLQVCRERSLVKRYGVIFICLAMRTVHIEVAHSMETDSFLMALRRFIARRGQVKEIRSKNGTNFTSRERVSSGNSSMHGITTRFKPYGSHYGGVWERCIWTTCKVPWTLLQTQTDDHEGLVTLLCEVESIINGRPITTVLGDSNGPEPLMPNHLLLWCAEPQMPPGLFQKEDSLWHRWRQVQYLAGIFWKWWSKEYLPLLQSRQKWTMIRKNLAVVLVRAENSRRNSWPLCSGRSLLTRKVWCIVQRWK